MEGLIFEISRPNLEIVTSHQCVALHRLKNTALENTAHISQCHAVQLLRALAPCALCSAAEAARCWLALSRIV